ncbi:GntR family transcriptional regulator [Streptomyces sp. NRRL S-237]|uniref:GntR family transcriptional regulator n=1 Tax=Streptomyces sp. NRRL S-237 TaxID=1463895 RepID=UPI002D21B310|nr:GntR family transcriptional regulator [Streptomyces sp. NRRL S-237]
MRPFVYALPMPDSPTDPNAPRAPYMRVLDALLADIRSGALPPGSRLPSEAELCAAHGVARMTARRAVGILREHGLVVTEWGKGSTRTGQIPREDE